MTIAISSAANIDYLSMTAAKVSKALKGTEAKSEFSQLASPRVPKLPVGFGTANSEILSQDARSESASLDARRLEARRQAEKQQQTLSLSYGTGQTIPNSVADQTADVAIESEGSEWARHLVGGRGATLASSDAGSDKTILPTDDEVAKGQTVSEKASGNETKAASDQSARADPSAESRGRPEEFAGLYGKAAMTKSGLERTENFAGQAANAAGTQDSNWAAAAMERVLAARGGQGSANGGAYDFLRSAFGEASLSALGVETADDWSLFGEGLANEGLSSPAVGLPTAVGRESLLGAMTTTAIKEAIGQPQWPTAFADRVEWLVSQRIQKATILVNPANLGPIEVSISIEGNKTHAVFFSQNPQVRETIEASLPQLQQMLSNIGVSLGDAGVAAESSGGQEQERAGQMKSTAVAEESRNDVAMAYLSTIAPVRSASMLFAEAVQLVDTFV